MNHRNEARTIVLLCASLLGGCGGEGSTSQDEPQLLTAWHDEAAQIKRSEGPAVAGQKEGEWTWWHPNGNTAVRGSFQDGDETGVWEEWHPNGTKKSTRTWLDGRAEGLVQEWHDNGRLSREATYMQGRAEGPFTEWHPDGAVSGTGQYSGGRLDGQQRAFWATGELKPEGAWADGAQVGVCRVKHNGLRTVARERAWQAKWQLSVLQNC